MYSLLYTFVIAIKMCIMLEIPYNKTTKTKREKRNKPMHFQ